MKSYLLICILSLAQGVYATNNVYIEHPFDLDRIDSDISDSATSDSDNELIEIALTKEESEELNNLNLNTLSAVDLYSQFQELQQQQSEEDHVEKYRNDNTTVEFTLECISADCAIKESYSDNKGIVIEKKKASISRTLTDLLEENKNSSHKKINFPWIVIEHATFQKIFEMIEIIYNIADFSGKPPYKYAQAALNTKEVYPNIQHILHEISDETRKVPLKQSEDTIAYRYYTYDAITKSKSDLENCYMLAQFLDIPVLAQAILWHRNEKQKNKKAVDLLKIFLKNNESVSGDTQATRDMLDAMKDRSRASSLNSYLSFDSTSNYEN